MQGPCVFDTGCRGARLLAWLILNDRVQPSLIAGVLVYLYVPYLTGRGVFTRGLCGVTGSRRGLSRKTAARQPSRYIQYNTIQYNAYTRRTSARYLQTMESIGSSIRYIRCTSLYLQMNNCMIESLGFSIRCMGCVRSRAGDGGG